MVKYNLSVLFFAATLIIAGCQVEDIRPSGVQLIPSDFVAETEASGTKTLLGEDWNIYWKQGDQMTIFEGGTYNMQYQVTDDSDGKSNAALNQVLIPGFVASTEISANVAYYPYSAALSVVQGASCFTIGNVNLPAVQNYALNSFGNGSFAMVAVTSNALDKVLRFRNLLGGVKLQLKGTKVVKSISITGNNGEVLCGGATVTAAFNAYPTIAMSPEGGKSVTLNCGEGVLLNESTATNFFIALPPMTFSEGFSVVVTFTDNHALLFKTTGAKVINRSAVLKMAELTMAPSETMREAVNLGLSVLWAPDNIGAADSYDYGSLFSWGELSTKSVFTSENYDTSSALTAYDSGSKTTLEPALDVVNANYGDLWRMPTNAEFEELVHYGTWTWTTMGGVPGYKVQSKIKGFTNAWIFLPAAGYGNDEGIVAQDTQGDYWSSSLKEDDFGQAYGLDFFVKGISTDVESRRIGRAVRGVVDLESQLTDVVLDVSLDKTAMSIVVGDSRTLHAVLAPLYMTGSAIVWSSSDTDIATVDENGVVTAVALGTCTITATSGLATDDCTITVTPATGIAKRAGDVDVRWIQIWNNGPKFAAWNIGATAPEEYGDYFAWGETQPYYTSLSPELTWSAGKTNGYAWPSYFDDTSGGFGRYFRKYTGTKTVLEPEDDAALVNWGENWRMPDRSELEGLLARYWYNVTENGVGGCKVKCEIAGNEDLYVFLPAAGRFEKTACNDIGEYVSVYSRTCADGVFSKDSGCAVGAVPGKSSGIILLNRCYGVPVRPVLVEEKTLEVAR